jgi:hypothetical protein
MTPVAHATNLEIVMYEERIGLCLLQMKHTRGHLGHIYSIEVNQVMVTTV